MQLTVRAAATLLRATEQQIYRWVDAGEIPFQRVRDQVRFNRTDLLEWATSRHLPLSLEAFDADLDEEDRAPSLAQAIRVGGVHHDVPGTDRETALQAVVERTPMPDSVDRELLFEVLVAREHTSSTAIGDGIAIPHVRQPTVAPGGPATVAVCHLATKLPFGAPDGKPVGTILMIISPTVRTHLQILAHVARALHDAGFKGALDRRAPTEELAAEAARVETPPPALLPGNPDEAAD